MVGWWAWVCVTLEGLRGNTEHVTPTQVFPLELLSRILKSLIKVGYPSRFKSFLSDFQHTDSPCSCGHFEMRLTYVGLLVPKL